MHSNFSQATSHALALPVAYRRTLSALNFWVRRCCHCFLFYFTFRTTKPNVKKQFKLGINGFNIRITGRFKRILVCVRAPKVVKQYSGPAPYDNLSRNWKGWIRVLGPSRFVLIIDCFIIYVGFDFCEGAKVSVSLTLKSHI